MQHIKISIPALFLLLALGACNKTKPYVAGRVTEAGTDKPIADARVFLTGCTGQLFGSLDCSVVDSTRSADDGTYRINGIEPQLADLITAVAPGYFSDMDSQASVPGDEFNPNINVKLFPHAWIRVKIINESGAWGFNQESNQSSTPPIQLAKGDSMVLESSLDFRKGNSNTTYIFSIRPTPGSGSPSAEYYKENVRALVNNIEVPIDTSFGAVLRFYLPGHDTTEVTIIY